jgi:prephenate dehydratase
MTASTNRIAFQGEFGANSDMACRDMFPDHGAPALRHLRGRLQRAGSGQADLAMIPIENTIAGRVADIHHLLPESQLHIVGEYFMPIHFQLMALPGVDRSDIKHRAQPCSCARPVPQGGPRQWLEGRGCR